LRTRSEPLQRRCSLAHPIISSPVRLVSRVAQAWSRFGRLWGFFVGISFPTTRLLYVLTPRSPRALQHTDVFKCLGDYARRKPTPVAGSRRTLHLGGGSVGGYKTTRRPPFPDVQLGPPSHHPSPSHLFQATRRLGDQATRDERFRSEVVPLGRPASEKQRVGSEQGEEQ
jgi:hypothetical protein